MRSDPNRDEPARQPVELPASPLTPTGQGAAALHELFMSYVTAGFTRPEALDIVIAQLVETMRWNNEHGDGS